MNAEPLTEPAALVLSVAWVAKPKVGVILWVAVVKETEVKQKKSNKTTQEHMRRRRQCKLKKKIVTT